MDRYTWFVFAFLIYFFIGLGVNSVITERVTAGDTVHFIGRAGIVVGWPILIGINLADTAFDNHPLNEVIWSGESQDEKPG